MHENVGVPFLMFHPKCDSKLNSLQSPHFWYLMGQNSEKYRLLCGPEKLLRLPFSIYPLSALMPRRAPVRGVLRSFEMTTEVLINGHSN